MRLFYVLVLLVGLYQAILMQFVCIALPSDAFVAYVLTAAPDHWTVAVDEHLAGQLGPYHDVKAQVAAALSKRAEFRKHFYSRNLQQGIVLIALSIIGLIRETQFNRLRRIRQTTEASAGSGTTSPPIG